MTVTQRLNPGRRHFRATAQNATRTISRSVVRAIAFTFASLALTAVANSSEILSDGNFDNLEVGTAPDNRVRAGEWFVHRHEESFEDDPSQFSIVETSSFDPDGTGRSLRIERPRRTSNTHLHHLFAEPIPEASDEIVRASFDVFVPDNGTNTYSDFDIYIGRGYHNRFHRGPQFGWDGRGRINADECGQSDCSRPRIRRHVDATPLNTWQHVQLDIDLTNDTYDLFFGTADDPLELVAPHIGFRSGPQDFLDRFGIAQFSNSPGRAVDAVAYVDNIRIEVIKKDWIGDANLDGEFNSGDLIEVFQVGKYETGELAGWSQGDWNADRVFDSSDVIAAFQDGGYEMGPRAAVASVPEPSSLLTMLFGMLGIGRIRRR